MLRAAQPSGTSHKVKEGINVPHIWGWAAGGQGRDLLPRKPVIIPAGDWAPY